MSAPLSVPESCYANADGQAIVSDGQFLWYHDGDGKVRWKMLGSALRAPEADGSVWVLVENTLKHISAGGDVLSSVPLTEPFLGLSPDGRTVYLQRKGAGDHTRAGSQLVAPGVSPAARSRGACPSCRPSELA